MTEIAKKRWGALPSGEALDLYTFRNANGIEASITNYGGRLVTLKTPDRDGRFADIVLGFDDPDEYLKKNPYFGALVGRYANRIANAEFTLDGTTYKLARNNGENSLHGGLKGFDKIAWKGEQISTPDGPALMLEYVSADGEEGYPGTLTATATYTLTDDNDLRIDYAATTDKKTVLNLTNHSYFDLAGQGSGDILDHIVTIAADHFTPVNAHLIPTGELRSVMGTPFDFTRPTRIGDRIDQDNEQLKLGAGYDHNFVLKASGRDPSFAARAHHPDSGRTLEVLTTQPGVQFYTGNHLADSLSKGKGGVIYGFRSGFCLETQHFPDSPNQPNFPSTELKPGEQYQQTTIFRFSIES
jgi:aldose 1-epimerase